MKGALKYKDYNNDPSKKKWNENKQELLKKKKELLTKVKNNKNTSERTATDINEVLNKKVIKLEKVTQKLRSDYNKEKIKNQKLEIENKEIKKKANKLENKLFQYQKQIDSFEKQIQGLQNELEKAREQISNFENEFNLKVEPYKEQIQKLQETINKQQSTILEMHFSDDVALEEQMSWKNKYNELLKENEKLESRLERHRDKVELLSLEDVPIPTLLEYVTEQLTVRTLPWYNEIKQLIARYQRVKQLYKDKETDTESKVVYPDNSKRVKGYIEFDKKQGINWFVDCFNNKKFRVTAASVDIENKQSVEAIIYQNDATAYVFRTFAYEESNNVNASKDSRKQTKKEYRTQNRTKKERRFDFNGMSCLILSGMSGNRIEKYLEKHNIDAFHFDPFEKNPNMLKELIPKFDIVLIFIRHVPHSVGHFIDDSWNAKYQYLKVQNEKLVLDRLRLVGKELGYI